jgi:hypothetical protein
MSRQLRSSGDNKSRRDSSATTSSATTSTSNLESNSFRAPSSRASPSSGPPERVIPLIRLKSDQDVDGVNRSVDTGYFRDTIKRRRGTVVQDREENRIGQIQKEYLASELSSSSPTDDA